VAIRRRWTITAGAFTAFATAIYVIAYIDFRNRSVHEMQSVNLTEGMIYDSVENLERTHDLSTHYSRARIFAPLNAIDCMFFGGQPPVLGIMFDLQ
jgi:hypothetical protein